MDTLPRRAPLSALRYVDPRNGTDVVAAVFFCLVTDLDKVQRPAGAAAGGEKRGPLVAGQHQVFDFLAFQKRRLQQDGDLAVAQARIQGDDRAE